MNAWQPNDEQIDALASAYWEGEWSVMHPEQQGDARDDFYILSQHPTFQSIIRAAQAEALREAARDNVKSWGNGGWLSCADKCGRPGCADDVRVDSAERVAAWMNKRADETEARS